MKNYKLILILILFSYKFSFAQSKDELEITQLETYWTDLLNKGDTSTLLKIWSDNYVVNNPNGKIVGPTEIITLMKNGHKFPLVERIIEKITFNDNVAIVMGKELQQPANLSTNLEDWIPRRFTNVWIKSQDKWQLAARQSTQITSK